VRLSWVNSPARLPTAALLAMPGIEVRDLTVTVQPNEDADGDQQLELHDAVR
jgi:hypothetical protein